MFQRLLLRSTFSARCARTCLSFCWAHYGRGASHVALPLHLPVDFQAASYISPDGGQRKLPPRASIPWDLSPPVTRLNEVLHVDQVNACSYMKGANRAPCSVNNTMQNVTGIFFPLKTDKKCIQEPVTKLHGLRANALYLHMTNYAFIHCLEVLNSLLVVNFLLEHTDGPAWSC